MNWSAQMQGHAGKIDRLTEATPDVRRVRVTARRGARIAPAVAAPV